MAEKEPGLLNIAIEDALAHAVTERERATILSTLLRLTVEYLARETGKNDTLVSLEREAYFVKTAQPSTPWPP